MEEKWKWEKVGRQERRQSTENQGREGTEEKVQVKEMNKRRSKEE